MIDAVNAAIESEAKRDFESNCTIQWEHQTDAVKKPFLKAAYNTVIRDTFLTHSKAR